MQLKGLPPPSPRALEQLVIPMKQETGSIAVYGQFSLWHVKQPVTQEIEIQETEIPEAKTNVPSTSDDKMLSSPTSGPSQLQSWRKYILKNCSSLASPKRFILSLPPEVQTLKDVEQGKTLCHILAGWCDEAFTSSDVIHLLELFEEHFLQQCMTCQDLSGNTPLHCSVDVKNAYADIVKFLLRFTSRESLLIQNRNNLTPLKLSFERKHHSIFELLIEREIETGTSAAECLQRYILDAANRDGGADFLSGLLDLRDRHCPDLDLNFGSNESRRTPCWYLVHSTTDVNVMTRVLQALKDH